MCHVCVSVPGECHVPCVCVCARRMPCAMCICLCQENAMCHVCLSVPGECVNCMEAPKEMNTVHANMQTNAH